MQDKFRELLRLAIDECHPDTSRPSKERTLQRFAELIVKECLDIVEHQKYNTDALLTAPKKSSAAYNAKLEIIKRFELSDD